MKQNISPVAVAVIILALLTAGGVLLWRATQPQASPVTVAPHPMFDPKTGQPVGIRNPNVPKSP